MCNFLSDHVVTRKGKDYGKVLVITGVHHEIDREDKRVSRYDEDLIAWESENLKDVEFTHIKYLKKRRKLLKSFFSSSF